MLVVVFNRLGGIISVIASADGCCIIDFCVACEFCEVCVSVCGILGIDFELDMLYGIGLF